MYSHLFYQDLAIPFTKREKEEKLIIYRNANPPKTLLLSITRASPALNKPPLTRVIN